MVLTFKAFDEICELLIDTCGVDEDTAETVAQKIFDIVRDGGVVDEDTATEQLNTIMTTFLTTGEVTTI